MTEAAEITRQKTTQLVDCVKETIRQNIANDFLKEEIAELVLLSRDDILMHVYEHLDNRTDYLYYWDILNTFCNQISLLGASTTYYLQLFAIPVVIMREHYEQAIQPGSTDNIDFDALQSLLECSGLFHNQSGISIIKNVFDHQILTSITPSEMRRHIINIHENLIESEDTAIKLPATQCVLNENDSAPKLFYFVGIYFSNTPDELSSQLNVFGETAFNFMENMETLIINAFNNPYHLIRINSSKPAILHEALRRGDHMRNIYNLKHETMDKSHSSDNIYVSDTPAIANGYISRQNNADIIITLPNGNKFAWPITPLSPTQDKIIESIIKILDECRIRFDFVSQLH